jgi:hypothetical protein
MRYPSGGPAGDGEVLEAAWTEPELPRRKSGEDAGGETMADPAVGGDAAIGGRGHRCRATHVTLRLHSVINKR